MSAGLPESKCCMANCPLFKKEDDFHMTFLVHHPLPTLACGKNDKTVDKGQKMFIDSGLEVYPLFCIILTCSNKKYVHIKYKSLFLYSNNKFLQYDSVFLTSAFLRDW